MTALIELYAARELLWTLVYRDIRGRTKASVLGYGWIVLQPLLATGLFTLLVERVLGINPSGSIPYPVFLFAAMTVWSYFSGAVTMATESLVANADLLRQVRFPREVLVLQALFGKFLDFGISLPVLVVLCVLYGVRVQPGLLLAPLFALPAVFFAYGLSLILAPLNVVLRDVGKAVPLLMSFAIYAAPVVYPLSKVPERWRSVYILNPVVGAIEGFRDLAVLGQLPPLGVTAAAWIGSLAVLLIGQWVFDRFENALGDVV